MNLALLRLAGLITICVGITGCPRPVPPRAQEAKPSLYTEQDVQRFVLPGTPIDAIIKRFGEPWGDQKNPKFEDGSTDIDEIVYFGLPPPPFGANKDLFFAGFQVRLKDRKAVEWSATYGSDN